MAICIVLTVLISDQLSKFFATRYLSLNNPLPVVNNFFSLTLVHNRGAAFGVLKGQFYLFILFSIIAIVLIWVALKNQKKINLYVFSLCLLLGGTLGNLIDRISFGYVIDFLDFHVWPVFNIADSSISVGALLLAWSVIKTGKKYAS